jgi:hypothetical protein
MAWMPADVYTVHHLFHIDIDGTRVFIRIFSAGDACQVADINDSILPGKWVFNPREFNASGLSRLQLFNCQYSSLSDQYDF